MTKTTALLPDTNVFLHYKPLKDIDWRALAGGDALVVVCLQVIKELDEKKNHTDLSERASRAIREIRAIIKDSGDVRPGVTLVVFNEEIRVDRMPAHMSPDSADDRIVYQAKQYAEANPDAEVVIVTEDLGMELRCTASEVRALAPLPGDRLPSPESELKKSVRELMKENLQLKNTVPKLSVRLRGGTNDDDEPFTITLARPTPLDPDAETNRERERHPKLFPKSSASQRIPDALNMNAIPAYEYDRYNREIEEYFSAYADAVPLRSTYLNTRARSFAFEAVLRNDGTLPAEDVDIYIRIPSDIIESVTEDDDNDLTIPPTPRLPKRPSSPLQDTLAAPYRGGHVPNPDLFRPPTKHDGLQWAKVSREKDLFIIRAKVGRLKHLFTISLGTFRARFASWDLIRPVQVVCSITAANHPGETKATLVLRVTRADGPAGADDSS